MRRRVLWIIVVAGLICETAHAQRSDSAALIDSVTLARFIQPLKEYNGFAGTYGELRGNHFHCGLDMRTGGAVGKRVYAADDGYVSCLSVAPNGFGNMITVTHKGGYKTIYGHLLRFAEPYHKYLRERQLAEEKWEQDIYLDSLVFPVKRGDCIALSGNSGSSGGPHLHFEVLDPEGTPINLGLTHTFDIQDHRAPVFRDVKFFGAMEILGAWHTYPIAVSSKRAPGSVVRLPYRSYLAIDAYDTMEGSGAKLAVFEYEVTLDSTSIFRFTEGNIPYAKGRHIASLLQHSLKLSTGRCYVKTALDEGCELRDRIYAPGGGYIVLDDTLTHRLKICVTDVYGNKAQRTYLVKRLAKPSAQGNAPLHPEGMFWAWDKPFKYREGRLEVEAEGGLLFRSVYFSADTLPQRVTPYSLAFRIGDREVPFLRKVNVKIKADIPQGLEDKAVIAKVSASGAFSGTPAKYSGGWASGAIGAFGTYCVSVDTVAPSVAFRFQEGAHIKSGTLRIAITDRISGIKEYRAEIDGEWVVAAFDGKTATLNIALTEFKNLKRGKRHTLKVTVADNVGNQTVRQRHFIY